MAERNRSPRPPSTSESIDSAENDHGHVPQMEQIDNSPATLPWFTPDGRLMLNHPFLANVVQPMSDFPVFTSSSPLSSAMGQSVTSPTPINTYSATTPATSLEPQLSGNPAAENEDTALSLRPELQAPHDADHGLSDNLTPSTEGELSTDALSRASSDIVGSDESTEFGRMLYERAQKMAKRTPLGALLYKVKNNLGKPFQKQQDPPITLPTTREAPSRVSMASGSSTQSIGGVVVEPDPARQHNFEPPQRQRSTALVDQQSHHPKLQVYIDQSSAASQLDGGEGVIAMSSCPSSLAAHSPVAEQNASLPHVVGLGSNASIPMRCLNADCTLTLPPINIASHECLTTIVRKLLDVAAIPRWGCAGTPRWQTLVPNLP
ncbi:hypothetical protein BKA70DRAFT_1441384 [Coprinopsis sp. MPI-PUGE-AT-0042]|nr:hypothetical protein BKA70DRAFT_1441384 [Coprinopsis sp. MPI-PUGE-AT-0042]